MCGFFIRIKKHGNYKYDKNKFLRSGSLIKHRGPDDYQTYFEKNVDIIFYRLSLRDLSIRGRQPMKSKSGRYLICFNGEIYNSNDLYKKYLYQSKLKSSSDTEILIETFEKIGSKVFSELEGMFSFFIYDLKMKKFIISRDRFGMKQLYYFSNNEIILLSSEIKPILKYTQRNNINDLAVADFLLKGHLDHDKTFFSDIHLFPVGSFGVIKDFNLTINSYWSLKEKNNRKNLKDSGDQLKYLFENSIKKHLISDKKVCVFLSGGIDSSVMAKEMQKKLNYKLNSYTYDFSNNIFSESSYAKEISQKLNIKNTIQKTNYKFVDKNFEKLIKIVESPITSLRLFGVLKNYDSAAKDNFRVVFEGHGGDEQFGGYQYNYIFHILDKIKNSKKNLKLFDKLLFGKFFRVNNKNDLINLLMTSSFQSGSTSDGTPFVNIDLFNKDFLRKNISDQFYYEKQEMGNILKNSQYLDIKKIKLPRVLKFTDRISMNFGIETRLPYLDNNLFESSFNLPNNFKFRHDTSRWIFKKKFSGSLNLTNQKRSIVDPQTKWFKKEFNERFNDMILSNSFKNSNYFSHKDVKKYYENFKKNNFNSSFNLIQILSLHYFLKIFKNSNF